MSPNKYFMTGTVSTHTLVWYARDGVKPPWRSGNCFSVVDGWEKQEYRVVNFFYENYQQLETYGVEPPYRFEAIGPSTCVLADGRIPKKWYSNIWCETCCPAELLPEPQKLQRRLMYMRGELRDTGKVTIHDFSKTPTLHPTMAEVS